MSLVLSSDVTGFLHPLFLPARKIPNTAESSEISLCTPCSTFCESCCPGLTGSELNIAGNYRARIRPQRKWPYIILPPTGKDHQHYHYFVLASDDEQSDFMKNYFAVELLFSTSVKILHNGNSPFH